MNEVRIICPKQRPGEGGLIDYSQRLIEQWGTRAQAQLLFPQRENFRAQWPTNDGKVLLQYSAYGFDPIGYPRWLLRELMNWKQENPRALLVVMFHEIWTFWPWLNQNRLVQRLHRADIARLMASADAIFTSTPSQAEHLHRLVAHRKVELLPVGSNIRRLGNEQTRAPRVAVLFGVQANRLRTLRALRAGLSSLEKIIAIGPLDSAKEAEEEAKILTALALPGGFEQRGQLPEAEVSQHLLGASFGLSAQDPLSIMKSGTFMAYAAHGLNILSPHADPAGPEPLNRLTSPAELRAGISEEEWQRRAADLRAWQERTASWPRIAERFAEALQLEPSKIA